MGREYKEKDATVKQQPDGEVDRINVLPLGEIRWMNHDLIQQFVPELHRNLSSLLQAEDWTAQLIRYHVHEKTRSLQQVALPAMLDFN